MLEQQLKKLDFYKGAKFEVKGKQLLVRSSDRTALQEKTEKYFNRSKIQFKPRKKATELDVIGASQVLIFKPIAAKGAGGLKFEDQIVNDLNKFNVNNIDIRASSSAINDKMLEKLKNF